MKRDLRHPAAGTAFGSPQSLPAKSAGPAIASASHR
jgi:hypothetical protein